MIGELIRFFDILGLLNDEVFGLFHVLIHVVFTGRVELEICGKIESYCSNNFISTRNFFNQFMEYLFILISSSVPLQVQILHNIFIFWPRISNVYILLHFIRINSQSIRHVAGK